MPWWQQLLLIVAWGVTGGLVVWTLTILYDGRRLAQWGLLVFAISFLVRALVAVVNEEFSFLNPKLAGNYSMELFEDYLLLGAGTYGNGRFLGLMHEQFAAQVLLNLPFWLVFGLERISLVMSNAMVGAIVAPVAGGLLLKPLGSRAATRIMLLIAVYPGLANFSIFGLRDPLIFFSMTVLACGVVRAWIINLRPRNLLLIFGGGGLTLWLRPELAYVVFVVAAIPLLHVYLEMLRGSRVSQRHMANLIVATIPLVIALAAMAAAATTIASRNIGGDTANPFDVAGDTATDRFERHTGRSFGAGSNISDSESYANMPVYLRIPVQTVGLIVLPFPWQIQNVPRLFAFVDSMLIIATIGFVVLNSLYSQPFRSAGQGRLAAILFMVFTVGILGMGFVVNNSGNGFRMRLAVTPLLFVAAATVPGSVRFSLFPHSGRSRSNPSSDGRVPRRIPNSLSQS